MRKIGDEVWVVSIGEPKIGTIVDLDICGEDEYDVEVHPRADGTTGSVTHCGLPLHRLHDEKKGAVMEIYSFWAEQHHKMGRILQKASAFFDDPDALIKHLEQIEICSIVENT